MSKTDVARRKKQINKHLRIKGFEKDGYIVNIARLLQLTARCVLFGSGNMTQAEKKEMERLACVA
jgi:hypothetical protein